MTFANFPPGPPPPPPPPPSYQPAPAPSGSAGDNRTLYVILSYLGLLALVPLLVEKNDPEVQWHAKHGLVLTVAEFVVLVALGVFSTVLSFVTAGLGCLITVLFPFLGLGILVLHVLCIAKGLKGERFLIPGLSEFADRF
jgi:uncharacterized membrane protein